MIFDSRLYKTFHHTCHRLEFFQAVLVCLDKVQTHFFLGQKTFGFLIYFSKNLWFFDIILQNQAITA